MTKNQHNLIQTFNQELNDLQLVSNSQLFTSKNALLNTSHSKQAELNSQSAISTILLTPLYQFQQKTIEMQQLEIDALKKSHNSLLADLNEQKIEVERCKREIEFKVCLFFDYFKLKIFN
jgi:hypothetical protein